MRLEELGIGDVVAFKDSVDVWRVHSIDRVTVRLKRGTPPEHILTQAHPDDLVLVKKNSDVSHYEFVCKWSPIAGGAIAPHGPGVGPIVSDLVGKQTRVKIEVLT